MTNESSSAASAHLPGGAEGAAWGRALVELPFWRSVLGAGVGGVLVTLACRAANASESWRSLILMSVLYLVPLGCWLWVIRRRGQSSREVLGEALSLPIARQAIVVALATFIVHLGWVWLVTALDRVPESWTEPIVETHGAAQEIAWALVAIVLDPPVEELAFRGVLYQRLRRRVHPAWAALGTSVFFGLLHPDPVGMTLLGLALTALVRQTRSLWAPIIAHACNNALGVLLSSEHVSLDECPLWLLGVAQLVCVPWVFLLVWRSLRRAPGGEAVAPSSVGTGPGPSPG
jgi:membrane protease YdiL (CAAX protease family)